MASALTPEKTRKLWEEIVQKLPERDSFYRETPRQVTMGPPASPAELAAVEKHLGVRLPPSYATFLSLYNGVQNFFEDVPLLSTREIIAGEGLWREDVEDADAALAKFVFAGCGTSFSGWFCFDTRTAGTDGEMRVIYLARDGGRTRYKNFGAFLQSYLKVVKETIAMELADRANLKD